MVDQTRHILAEVEAIGERLAQGRQAPRGLLRVNATLGFGRRQVAPVVSRFIQHCPDVEVQLQRSVNPPPLTDDAFDVCIRFGEPPDNRVIAHRRAANRRLLCAAPAYLQRHGEIAVAWALDGHRIVMRAEWDLAPHLRRGRLVPVISDWSTPEADIHAVVPQRLHAKARVRASVDFIAEAIADIGG